MNQWEQAIVERTEAALRQTERYREKEEWEVPPDENFQLSYILTKGDLAEPETILAIAICDDETFLFYPLKVRPYTWRRSYRRLPPGERLRYGAVREPGGWI